MNAPATFSGVLHIPNPSRYFAVICALAAASLPILAAIAVVIWSLRSQSGGFLLAAWGWPGIATALAVLALCASGLIVLGRRLTARHIRRTFSRWLAAAPATPIEQAAARFYLDLVWAKRSARAAAVTSFLAAVPVDHCRTLILGDHPVRPMDDGALGEECDAFEGRARKVHRWLVALLAVPFVLQVSLAIGANGINPMYWSGRAMLYALPALFNLVLMLFVLGVFRPIGTVVLATPRRVQYSGVSGTLVFTPGDSVLLVGGFHRTYVAAFYRNDGRMAGIQYPSLDTPGFKQLINRWCMTAAARPQTPTPTAEPAT